MKRVFMKTGAMHINGNIQRVEFEFDEDSGAVSRRAMSEDEQVRSICPWSFKDALSLVASGNWAEVVRNEQTGRWWAPSTDELDMIAKRRTSMPDLPSTVVELVW